MRLTRVLLVGALSLLLGVTTCSAYIRLADSSYGCEPWPLCHAEAGGEAVSTTVTDARRLGRARGVHRSAAMLVTFWLLALLVVGWARMPGRGARAALVALFVLVGLLATLGIVTPGATLPAVTLGNLLGGMLMLAFAAWLLGASSRAPPPAVGPRRTAMLALSLCLLQIALGALLNARVGASACGELPLCTPLWPTEPAAWRVLDPFAATVSAATPAVHAAALALLHNAHRVLGVALVLCVLWLTLGVERAARADAARHGPRALAWSALVLTLAQAVAGIAMVAWRYPLAGVLLHNVLAALLVVSLAALLARLGAGARPVRLNRATAPEPPVRG